MWQQKYYVLGPLLKLYSKLTAKFVQQKTNIMSKAHSYIRVTKDQHYVQRPQINSWRKTNIVSKAHSKIRVRKDHYYVQSPQLNLCDLRAIPCPEPTAEYVWQKPITGELVRQKNTCLRPLLILKQWSASTIAVLEAADRTIPWINKETDPGL